MDASLRAEALDRLHLERARLLGRRGWGHVHPNPMVGCVLVKDGRVVGEGWHREFGGPHAEIAALEAAGVEAEGSTAYVTLEPCDHEGKTPPCSQALIRAGVTRVVYGADDPGERSGGGAATLRRAGVDVVGPLWDAAMARAENPAFFHAAAHAEPFVALKLALSLDARIARAPGETTPLTGPRAQEVVHHLRTGFDAVMVGAGTVRADDPRLTVRFAPPGRTPPARVVLAPDASVPADAALLQDLGSAPLHVFCRLDAPEGRIEALEAAGARVHPVAADPRGRLELDAVLEACWDLRLQAILCEGGAALAASLLREDRVHRLYLLYAPFTLGEPGLAGFPPDGSAVPPGRFRPIAPPELAGRDTFMVLDRTED